MARSQGKKFRLPAAVAGDTIPAGSAEDFTGVRYHRLRLTAAV